MRSRERQAATARVVRSKTSSSVHEFERGSQHQRIEEAPSRTSSSTPPWTAFQLSICGKDQHSLEHVAPWAAAARRTLEAIVSPSPVLHVADSMRPVAIASVTASADATEAAAPSSAPKTSPSDSAAELSCCAAAATADAALADASSASSVLSVDARRPADTAADAADVAASASAADSTAAAIASTTAKGIEEAPDGPVHPRPPTAAIAICCMAAMSSLASISTLTAWDASGAQLEDAAVATTAADEAATAALKASAVCSPLPPECIIIDSVAAYAACVAALRVLDADSSAASRPTMQSHGPSAQGMSRRRICDRWTEMYSSPRTSSFQTSPEEAAAAVA
mmetsp:Transcript_28904/g.92481  ORF Transcript_28904/g.92481 Transcript_28904/m.92481 type:complete len:340 (-) Transcript_28904:272-1291(-)